MNVAYHFFIAGTGTLFSRLLGFARDASIAWLLGSGLAADTLSVALRLPYLVRRMFGEGTLSLALTASCAADGSSRLAKAAERRLIGPAALITLVSLCAAPLIIRVIAPGIVNIEETVLLLRICLPYIFFALLASCCMAGLHASGRFALPSLALSIFNLSMLTAAGFAVALAPPPQAKAICLACGVLVGGVMQWLLLHSACSHLIALAPPDTRKIRTVLTAMPGGLLAAAVPQLSFTISAIPVSFQEHGRLTAFFFAERLLEFPLCIVAASLGMAVVPRLAAKDSSAKQNLSQKLHASFSLALMITLPATFGLAACASPLVRLLLQHGAFDARAVECTANVLRACAPILPAYALSRPLLAACHALGLNRNLSAQAMLALALSLLGGLVCSRLLPGAAGPATGICLGVWVQTCLLWKTVQSRCRVCLHFFLTLLFLVGSLGTYAVARAVCQVGAAGGWSPLFCLAVAVLTGVVSYALFLAPAYQHIKQLLTALKKM